MRVARRYPIRSVGRGRVVLAEGVDASAMGPLDTSQMEKWAGERVAQKETRMRPLRTRRPGERGSGSRARR